ncbi:GIY-YIG nuclease family protein [Candidatus Parcubacteria bacterium]|nr:GIY-YIG nuclease family protein [Candidatus Parcubacteria bacterium]
MDIKKIQIPRTPGCYQFLNRQGKIIYIGKAADLKSRVLSYWRKSAGLSGAKQEMIKEIADIKYIETDSEIEALLLESNLIKKHQPKYNIDLRDDKRFVYIKISTEDEIPGVFITRKIEKQGKYFGPFTSVLAVRDTLKAIRKVWPYCTERKIKNKPCFYAQINRCTGVCGGDFDLAEYKSKIIKPIVMFLSGEKNKLIFNYELQITNLEKKLKNNKNDEKIVEEIILLKRKLLNLKYVLACANIIGISEKYAADVIELAKVLGLPKVPERIEGYDISNIFGHAAVGSMVVFSNGEPEKSEYRKFKIKVSSDLGDIGMLREVLERRIRHISHNTQHTTKDIQKNQQDKKKLKIWTNPDLIIVDGGKGQLNLTVRLLKKEKLDIPVIAVSKGKGLRGANAPDKIFFPREKKPLELPLASPTLHVIKRVRDEAHRFAIKYHRELRQKKFIT